MVSSNYVKFRSPVLRSCLVALSVILVVDAVLIIYSAIRYPYLVDLFNNDLYMSESNKITVMQSFLTVGIILLAISTVVASYKSETNYILIHSGISGVFVPLTIAIYFTSSSYRYRIGSHMSDLHDLISDYQPSGSKRFGIKSSIYLIDPIQSTFKCCGIEGVQDWRQRHSDYLPPTCCHHSQEKVDPAWASLFKLDSDHNFKYCPGSDAFHLACSLALKEDESAKFAWMSDLLIITTIFVLADTIMSLLLVGLTKSEDSQYQEDAELTIVGVSSHPRPSQPTITSIKHRPSVAIQDLEAHREAMAARAKAIKFNLPRQSISGPSKFSAAARRGSSFI